MIRPDDLTPDEREKDQAEDVMAPIRPFCVGCKTFASDHPEYIEMGEIEGMTPDEYCRAEEGTYNRTNGHFLCTTCYIAAGMPSSSHGWVCP